MVLLDAPLTEIDAKKRLTAIDKNFKQYHLKGLNKIFVQEVGTFVGLFPYACFNWFYNNVQSSAGWSAVLFGDNYEILGRQISNIHAVGGIQMEELGMINVLNQ